MAEGRDRAYSPRGSGGTDPCAACAESPPRVAQRAWATSLGLQAQRRGVHVQEVTSQMSQRYPPGAGCPSGASDRRRVDAQLLAQLPPGRRSGCPRRPGAEPPVAAHPGHDGQVRRALLDQIPPVGVADDNVHHQVILSAAQTLAPQVGAAGGLAVIIQISQYSKPKPPFFRMFDPILTHGAEPGRTDVAPSAPGQRQRRANRAVQGQGVSPA